MSHRVEELVEDIAFCEGDTKPLEQNRTGELAMECWNLRKTIMEHSSQSIKYKKEIMSLKNLVKSLQKVVSEVEAESLLKTKDIHAKKTTILQCEKKIHELVTNNTFLNGSFTRSKKVAHNLQHKLELAEKENELLVSKLYVTLLSFPYRIYLHQ
jgi:predicted RNase H-like nuclease (RuvC/YqgF family)